jgi:hypothetical protein
VWELRGPATTIICSFGGWSHNHGRQDPVHGESPISSAFWNSPCTGGGCTRVPARGVDRGVHARSCDDAVQITQPDEFLTRGGPHVFVDVLGEYVERHAAAEHHGIVERLHVEPRSECRRRLLALPIDLAVTHLVAARLAAGLLNYYDRAA